jgi:hypothetical protein
MNTTQLARGIRAVIRSGGSWTEPFHGVQHLGAEGSLTRSYWATVEDHGTFASLCRWFPGCGFEPHRSDHKTLAEAKRLGERWVRNGVLNRI